MKQTPSLPIHEQVSRLTTYPIFIQQLSRIPHNSMVITYLDIYSQIKSFLLIRRIVTNVKIIGTNYSMWKYN